METTQANGSICMSLPRLPKGCASCDTTGAKDADPIPCGETPMRHPAILTRILQEIGHVQPA